MSQDFELVRRLLHAKDRMDADLSTTEIAFQTGWKSLGTFGRTFRDVTDASPGAIRARERAAPYDLERGPAGWSSRRSRWRASGAWTPAFGIRPGAAES